MPPVTVERRRAADAEELFRAYQGVFGEPLTDGSRRRWQWQYLENPETDLLGPEIWVAREGETLLGQYASMPVRLQWNGALVRASWGMDVFLRPEARGRGLGAQLFTTWSDHVEVALGLGLTASSYGLFKKLRYQDVGPVPFFEKVIDPVAVARRHVGASLAGLAGGALRLGLRILHPEPGPPTGGVAVHPIAEFSGEYDALWERVRSSYAMCARRDRSYLNWKYVHPPTRRYDLWEARRAAELTGYAVSRHEDYRGLRIGWLIDVFAAPADHETKDALIAEVLRGFAASGVARAQAFSMNGALASDLLRRGFLRGRSPMQFCVHSRVPNGDVFGELERWHVVFGDSDMDR